MNNQQRTQSAGAIGASVESEGTNEFNTRVTESFSITEEQDFDDDGSEYNEYEDYNLHNSTGDGDNCPYGCCEKESLGEFILKRGFFEGACSDVTIKAFGQDYKLHRLILDRSGYFSSLFTGPWKDMSNNVHELIFDDENITQESFELAIAKLYGGFKAKSELQHCLSMIAIGQYLDIPDIVCTSTDFIIKSLNINNISKFADFALKNNYGKASERIIESIKGFLCIDGWQTSLKVWEKLPSVIIGSVVGLDSFFIPSEWDRVLFILKLIERKQHYLKNLNNDLTIDEINLELDPIFFTLNNNVYFCHLTAEQLHKLESMTDYIDPTRLRDALWLRIALHKKISKINEKSSELGLVTTSNTPPNNIDSWFVPTKDETLYGTPEQLNNLITNNNNSKNNRNEVFKITNIPPFRFSIAFSQVSELQPEKRVYAKTLWHAGSYWNLYIQKIKTRKGYQMGVYIHRASSSAPSKTGILNKDVLKKSSNEFNGFYGVNEVNDLANEINTLSVSDSINSLPNDDDDDEADINEHDEEFDGEAEDDDDEFLKYEDKRIKTAAYYIIYTPSRKIKTSLTCFISTPDLFNKSQSWGWKSNSMCSFNEDGTLSDGKDKLLKFMVVLGNT